MDYKKILQYAGLMLVILGSGLTLYDLFTSSGDFLITKSSGFYIFIFGLLLSMLGRNSN